MVPLSIVIAGLLVAGAVYLTNDKSGSDVTEEAEQPAQQEEQQPDLSSLTPVTDEDHIIGNPNASVILVEYSDLECPFCSKVHPTIEKIVEEYDGKVAWVYRHFPLSQIHPNAGQLALASECVAKEGGNDSFWSFIGKVFEQGTKGEEAIVTLANQIGLNGENVRACINSDEFQQDVIDDRNNAVAVGAQGTPYTVVVGPNGLKATVNGAQPIEAFRQVIDTILGQQ